MKQVNSKILNIFYNSDIKNINEIIEVLTDFFDNYLKIQNSGILNLPNNAYDSNISQYDAEILLKILVENKLHSFGLWIISEDIFTSKLNFVFGLARYYDCAVVSIYRLHSQQMIIKECVHEIGHVLGLSHCENKCVMQFSNSLWKAKRKPDIFCEKCKKILEKKY